MAGMTSTGLLFDKLSEYFNEDNPKIKLESLDKLQEELDLDIVEWQISESELLEKQRTEGQKTIMTKYLERYKDLTKDKPRYKLLPNGVWVYSV